MADSGKANPGEEFLLKMCYSPQIHGKNGVMTGFYKNFTAEKAKSRKFAPQLSLTLSWPTSLLMIILS